MSQELATRFDPRAIESERYRAWQEGGHFHVPASAVLEDGRDPYVIVIPPPNVTAVLHMGHGLNNTIQDVLIRWRRMQGRASLWVPGTDHAGIATQNVVERRLAAEGTTRDDLGREAFVERVWDFVRPHGRHDPRPAQGHRRELRLGAHAVHARRRAQPRRARGVRPPLREGAGLPRGVHHQLVSRAATPPSPTRRPSRRRPRAASGTSATPCARRRGARPAMQRPRARKPSDSSRTGAGT